MAKTKSVIEYGDFQTPIDLAETATHVLSRSAFRPETIIEPTCGKGSFLVAATKSFPDAKNILGFDVNPEYISEARRGVACERARIECADFFAMDWQSLLSRQREPILVVGNPPWVTNAALGSLGSSNLPEKTNFQLRSGFDAKTGKSNFDISEWMLIKFMELLNGRKAALGMLCKTAVARKTLFHAWKNDISIAQAAVHLIDTAKHFNAAVDACFLVCKFSEGQATRQCDVFAELGSTSRLPSFGYRDGNLIANTGAYERWHHLQGKGGLYRWRSGIKHDCSKVMELTKGDDKYVNGLGEEVKLEPEFLYPMLKSSQLANGSTRSPSRVMLVTQQRIGEETEGIKTAAPKTWDYLCSHAEALNRRASSIYRNRPPFSVFGVGDYSFAPFKVAISGFYKKLEFSVLGRHAGKPIVPDDTSYFIPCMTEREAKLVASLLNSDIAREFFSAFIFWDSKRPITVGILDLLDIEALARELNVEEQLASFHPKRQKALW